MKVFVSVGVVVGLGADGEVEVDDRKLAGPFFHPVEYFRRQYMYPAEGIFVILVRIEIGVERLYFARLAVAPNHIAYFPY